MTSAARTAFDLGRRGPWESSVMRLDALYRATGLTTTAVAAVADGHAGARGLVQLRRVLDLVDPGAESPKETWLRLLIVVAGLPVRRKPFGAFVRHWHRDGHPRLNPWR